MLVAKTKPADDMLVATASSAIDMPTATYTLKAVNKVSFAVGSLSVSLCVRWPSMALLDAAHPWVSTQKQTDS